MARIFNLTVAFLIVHLSAASQSAQKGLMSALEEKIEIKLSDYVLYLTKLLESINDRYLGNSELGRLLHYEDIKPKLGGQEESRSMKKMSMMGMMPLIFHVGATSTWMILTTLLAAKSVAIGIILLVFKIAVSSAKVASFFTALKAKHSDHHSHGWWAQPHFDHSHERSFSDSYSQPMHSYSPEWTDHQEYKTMPYEEPLPEIMYAESKKKLVKA